MKKVIIITLILFANYGQSQTLNYIFNHSGLDPTIHAHQKPLSIYDLQYLIFDVPDSGSGNCNIAMFPGYYTQQSQAYTSDSTLASSYFTVSSEGSYWASVTNTTKYNQFAHGITLNPYWIKFGNPNRSELTEVKIIAKLPVLTETTIDNIVTLENDTLKVIHLSTPLSVEGFKKLITNK